MLNFFFGQRFLYKISGWMVTFPKIVNKITDKIVNKVTDEIGNKVTDEVGKKDITKKVTDEIANSHR